MASFMISAEPQLRHNSFNAKTIDAAITLVDVTCSNRIGFRGQQVATFLQAQGLDIPQQPNRAVVMNNGLIILSLSQTEFWLLDIDNQHRQLMIELETLADITKQVTRLYTQHSQAMFIINGDDCPQMFAKVCAVNLHPDAFESGVIAQTSVARVSSVVVNVTHNEQPTRFIILSDISSAQYLWQAIEDAAAEFQL
ncbi:hypothetical protein [Shewanella marina]|uniref:hypothetical protein n=1 Tax=Shewanella marina TaxID=487319 RepID=UPI00046FA6A0|nr:hypothetical protein [Shewanella marina]